ncbi:nuclear transport factor 2 family protein [Streptomyces sp. NK08204]|uniref:nuclear transport factor 2 family protein n=1 Tax=Streptomyces sp. NK08204 TaxID=2873260 RepID=UPI001CEDF24A|nr:nuclear transport factor 2 family protein [Streptomyces sp. NK08204]
MTETIETVTAQHRATVEDYVRFWNAQEPGEQQRLAAAVFTEDVRYYALIGVLSGPSALIGFREQFTQHMGGAVFSSRREPEILHGRARLMWRIEAGGKESFATGTDILVFDEGGRITTVSAFLDQAPEGFDPNASHD